MLGYHGCDRAVGEALLAGSAFEPSANAWDWLGPGVYFWEANPKRAFDFAGEIARGTRRRAPVSEPFVVGAVVNLGLCFDLSTKAGIDIAREAHSRLSSIYAVLQGVAGFEAPVNKGKRRDLDRAVIEFVHGLREAERQPSADAVRGVFIEGSPIYAGSGFHEKTHIQIAVRNLQCIKGVFRVAQHLYE